MKKKKLINIWIEETKDGRIMKWHNYNESKLNIYEIVGILNLILFDINSQIETSNKREVNLKPLKYLIKLKKENPEKYKLLLDEINEIIKDLN